MADRLGYSSLTINDIVAQVVARMNADPKFQTLRESSSAKMLINQFAGMTDMLSYYIERRAEESFLETAKLKSSVIQNAKQLGYVVRRPIPARASLSMTLLGDDVAWNGVQAEDTIQIPAYATFTFNGNKYLIKNTYIYTFTQEDLDNLTTSADYTKTIKYGLFNNEYNYNLYKDEDLVDEQDLVTVDILQSEKKFHFIDGANNEQLGKIFQVYNIPDETFSNIYGSDDYDNHVTKVATSNFGSNVFDPANAYSTPTTEIEYTIDRRSIMQTNKPVALLTGYRICLIRTNPNESVDLVFGDGIYAKKGAVDNDPVPHGSEVAERNISIQYLSTIGSKANELGVIGSKVTFDGEIITTSTSQNVKSQIEFKLTTNVLGGADMEDTQSIKLNAPAIFYSLDRCVTTGDYKAYLSTLTSPILVKNAIAWGEQEEGNGISIPKLFNIALFSCFGEMYRYNSIRKEWEAKESDTGDNGDMSDAVLDVIDIFGGGTQNGEVIADNNYFYMVVNDDSPGAARDSQLAETPSTKLGIVYEDLKNRSQITVRNVYVTPVIQEYELQGKIFISSLVDANAITTKIKNSIYSYLNTDANYNVPIRLSNLVDLIENEEGVLYCNMFLEPTDILDTTTIGREVIGVDGENVYNAVSRDSSVKAWIESFVSPTYSLSANIATIVSSAWDTLLTTDFSLDSFKGVSATENMLSKSFITESWFWKTFVKQCYDDLLTVNVGLEDVASYFSGTKYFDQLMMKFKNLFSYAIRYNTMVDSYGVKTEDIFNYTMKVELPKVTFKAGVMYK